MAITNAHFWYPDGATGSAYNLYHVQEWAEPSPNPFSKVRVRFINSGPGMNIVEFDKAAFEAAMNAHIAATPI